MIIFIVAPCADENACDVMAPPDDCGNILDVEPCCRAWAEVTVNGGKLAKLATANHSSLRDEWKWRRLMKSGK